MGTVLAVSIGEIGVRIKTNHFSWLKTLLLGVLVFFAPLGVVFVLTHMGAHSLAAANRLLSETEKPTDPALVKYHEVRADPTGLREPRALALGPDGACYVVGDSQVVRMGATGKPATVLTLVAHPYCLAVGNDGRYYVGLRDHVEVYNSLGALQARWPARGKAPYLTALAVHGNNVWVADAGDRAVWRYTRNGRYLAAVGQPDPRTGAPGLIVPSPHLDLASAHDGTLWVTDPGRHEVERYADGGALCQTWGQAGNTPGTFSGCCNPTNVALLADGGFVTAEKQRPRVKIYRAGGAFAGFVAGPESFTASVTGMSLAVDAHKNVLVLDTAQKTVRMFAPNKEEGTKRTKGT